MDNGPHQIFVGRAQNVGPQGGQAADGGLDVLIYAVAANAGGAVGEGGADEQPVHMGFGRRRVDNASQNAGMNRRDHVLCLPSGFQKIQRFLQQHGRQLRPARFPQHHQRQLLSPALFVRKQVQKQRFRRKGRLRG